MWYGEFTIAGVLVLGAALWATVALQRLRQLPPGAPAEGELPPLDAAFLEGGPVRVAGTVIVRMYREGRLSVGPDGLVTIAAGPTVCLVEAALIAAAGRHRSLPALRRAVARSAAVRAIGLRLAAQGLVRPPERYRAVVEARGLLTLAELTALVLGAIATIAWAVQPPDARDMSIPPFFAFFGLLLLGLLWLTGTNPGHDEITPAGVRQLDRFHEAEAHREDGPTPPEVTVR